MDVTIPKSITEIFRKKETFIIVREGKMGIECYADIPNIKRLSRGYKNQLKAFIDGVKEDMKR